VVIIEDVTTAGTSIRETAPILRAAARVQLLALIVAVDRQERGQGTESALKEIAREYGLQTLSIANIDQIIEQLRAPGADPSLLTPDLERRIREYRTAYGGT
jgi:orotate phosphoribosyltransferase